MYDMIDISEITFIVMTSTAIIFHVRLDKCIYCIVWDEITYLFPNVNVCTVEVWEYFISPKKISTAKVYKALCVSTVL